MKKYNYALSLDPFNSEAYVEIANTLAIQGKCRDVIKNYNAAIAQDPKNAAACSDLAIVFGAENDCANIDKAIAAFKKAVEYGGTKEKTYFAEEGAHLSLGIALRKKGKWDMAIRAFRRKIDAHPAFALAQKYLGLTLLDKGKTLPDKKYLAQAEEAFLNALKHDEKSIQSHIGLGLAYFYQNKHQDAFASFKSAIKLDPKNAAAYYHLGNALNGQGKIDEALAAYCNALKLDPRHVNTRIAITSAILKRTDRFDPKTTGALTADGSVENVCARH